MCTSPLRGTVSPLHVLTSRFWMAPPLRLDHLGLLAERRFLADERIATSAVEHHQDEGRGATHLGHVGMTPTASPVIRTRIAGAVRTATSSPLPIVTHVHPE